MIFCLYDRCLFIALLRLCNNLYLKTLRFISSNMSISPEVAPSLRTKPPSNYSQKNADICFYLTFNWLGLIGICSCARKCAKGSSDSIETAFDLALRTRGGPPAERRFTITNNAFAYGTSEQRQAIEKSITADATCKLTGGEQYRGATTRAIPSRYRVGPRPRVWLRWQRRKLHPIILQVMS